MQQREVEAWVVQVKAQGIFPIHAAPDRIGRLAVREPFYILHHDDQGQAPGGHFHRTALGGIEISKELIRIERAKLCPQVDIEIAFREGGAYCRRRHVWNGWEGFGAYAHGVPPAMTRRLRLVPSIAPPPRERPLASSCAARCRLAWHRCRGSR